MLRRTRDRHFKKDGRPKRILCLDGGGLRGALSLGILKELESFLRCRHGGDPRFRLAHYFDLIAGTSTGAIIAATLARGMTVEGIYSYYEGMGEEVFKTTLLGRMTAGLARPRYDGKTLERHLKAAVGETTRLGDTSLITGLLIVTKRIDSHSVWALHNNPKGKWFETTGGSASNKDYLLWKLLRASAAAPTYFDPVEVDYVEGKAGHFIDGGLSPFNDPSLQALMYATLAGYRVQWETGADKLLLVSVGTGAFEPPSKKAASGLLGGVKRRLGGLVREGGTVKDAFFSLLHDNQQYAKALMQWLSSSSTASEIDTEMGNLEGDLLGGRELLTYVRLDAELTEAGLAELVDESPTEIADGWCLKDVQPKLADLIDGRRVDLDSLTRMDESANVDLLWRLGRATGKQDIRKERLPSGFDLQGPAAKVFRVGIVGHRNNVLRARHITALEATVTDILTRVARVLGEGESVDEPSAGTVLCVVSPLAEGADRIAARAVLEARDRPPHDTTVAYALECPLPFDRDEYARDFRTHESRQEFRTLLGRADVVWELPGSREASGGAYAAVGDEVLERSDLLLAIWDGQEARGRGGTADVVRSGVEKMPVVWIHADPDLGVRLLLREEGGGAAEAPLSRLEAVVAGIR